MKFFWLSGLSILLWGCAGAPAGPPKLPASATFGWKLKSVDESKASSVKSWRAEYTGPGLAHVDVYPVQSQAEGLDRTQRWRPAAQTVTIFNAHYFVVIAWEGADRAAATALVGQIERSLPRSD